MSSQRNTAAEQKRGTLGGLGETLRTIVYAVLIALVVRTFVFEPFSIPSGSMLPTLMIGDYLFVSKYSYGYSRHSLPWSLPLLDGRVLASKQPVERGDVVVFKLPRDNRTDYIKRIIGLPGDEIQMRAGRLYINGTRVEREKVGSGEVQGRYGSNRVIEYIETLPNGVSHRIWEISDSEMLDDTPPYHVPQGYYFAMGDNRDGSLDSRVQDVGYVPLENLVGRAEIIFFSVNGEAGLLDVLDWPSAIRWRRIFDVIG